MRAPLLGDPTALGGLTARLAHPGVEPEVADEPIGRRETVEVADRRHDRERDGGVDARDRHEPRDLGSAQPDLPELSVDQAQLLAGEVELAQERLDRLALVGCDAGSSGSRS